MIRQKHIRMGTFYTYALLAVFSLAGAGCFSSSPQDPPQVIEYKRTGGIMGVNDHLVIRESGQAILKRSASQYELTVDSQDLAELRALLNADAFRNLKKEYLPSRMGADYFEYEVTYNGQSVRTQDMAIPEQLQPIIALLDKICESS